MLNKLRENIRSVQFLLRNQTLVKDFLNDQRGQMTLSDAPGAVLVIVLLGIVLAVGNIILDQMKVSSQNTVNNATINATIDSAISGLTAIANFQGTIGTVIAAAVVIGLVMGALVIGGEARGRGGL